MVETKPVLILAGTSEGSEIGLILSRFPQWRPILSLAGRLPKTAENVSYEIRFGGFGAVAGLVSYLRKTDCRAIIDATHPFAVRISNHAVLAAQAVQIPLLRINRAPWQPQTGDIWCNARDIAAAAAMIPTRSRVFLTIGSSQIPLFAARQDIYFLAPDISYPRLAPRIIFGFCEWRDFTRQTAIFSYRGKTIAGRSQNHNACDQK